MLLFNRRYGFVNGSDRYIGYLYTDTDTNRQFSIAHKANCNTFYINELDESFKPNDNTYSTVSTTDLKKAKNVIRGILENSVKPTLVVKPIQMEDLYRGI